MTENLSRLYLQTLKSISPVSLLAPFLERNCKGDRVHILSIGKAASRLAVAGKEILGPRATGGFVLTKVGHVLARDKESLGPTFSVFEAGHPVPTIASLRATRELKKWVRKAHGGELLVLISGGASSLLCSPAPPLKLADWQEINRALLHSGLPIETINVLRKHLSTVKGGQLAQLCSDFVSIEQFVLADICAPHLSENERLSLVGSGPFSRDPSSLAEAACVLSEIDKRLSPAVKAKAQQALRETSKATRAKSYLVAGHDVLLDSLKSRLEEPFESAPDWSELIVEDVQIAAGRIARFAQQGRPGLWAAVGEPTVRIFQGSPGKGGRCQELALRVAQRIAGLPAVTFLAGSSDGTDGPTQEAGAVVDGTTWNRLLQHVPETRLMLMLEHHDSGTALSLLTDTLLRTGPTGLNLNDLFLLKIGS